LKSPRTTRWVSYRSRKLPTDSAEDPTIFPNASCAVALIDRLTHHAEIVAIEGDSYRLRDAERSQKARRPKTAE